MKLKIEITGDQVDKIVVESLKEISGKSLK